MIGREKNVTRFAQPHVHTYMFCPYVISTLYHLLEELVQMRTFKGYFSRAILLTTLHLAKRNKKKIFCFITRTVFHRALASCFSRMIE
jgi:hypothetical protein